MRDWKKAEKWIQVRLVTREELSYGAATAGRAEVLAREVLEHWDTEKSYMPEWKELLSEQMNYTYPYLQEEQMKLKFTVSELKKRIYAGEQMREMQEERWRGTVSGTGNCSVSTGIYAESKKKV